ncbi:hypothetical protein QYE76_036436 [Lolium multiflorum]|uniref:Transposase-associated domain-containing protein n=1 Tax=Lolium multiflorum TaxID=4521 RepID=A0AAD8R4X0_LOLMU|nr:hypothetical protein QYE76_036436 [Lolium multiflorum]
MCCFTRRRPGHLEARPDLMVQRCRLSVAWYLYKGRRVPRVVLKNVPIHLRDEIGADVCHLGLHAATGPNRDMDEPPSLELAMDRSWITDGTKKFTTKYVAGVRDFIKFAQEHLDNTDEPILCPCKDCLNLIRQDIKTVEDLSMTYTRWTRHGEDFSDDEGRGRDDDGAYDSDNDEEEDNGDCYVDDSSSMIDELQKSGNKGPDLPNLNKDTVSARIDLKKFKMWEKYWLKKIVKDDGDAAVTYAKPPAPWTLSKEQKRHLCRFFKDGTETRFNKDDRNQDIRRKPDPDEMEVFSVGAKGLGKSILKHFDKEFDKMVWYVLNNCDDVEPFINEFRQELGGRGVRDMEETVQREFADGSNKHGDRSVYLFRCDWFDLASRGSKIKDDGYFKSVNTSVLWFKNSPFILASQAETCFYLEDTKFGDPWKVVQKFSHRHVYDVPELEDGNDDAFVRNEDAYQEDEGSVDHTFHDVVDLDEEAEVEAEEDDHRADEVVRIHDARTIRELENGEDSPNVDMDMSEDELQNEEESLIMEENIHDDEGKNSEEDSDVD